MVMMMLCVRLLRLSVLARAILISVTAFVQLGMRGRRGEGEAHRENQLFHFLNVP